MADPISIKDSNSSLTIDHSCNWCIHVKGGVTSHQENCISAFLVPLNMFRAVSNFTENESQ